MLDTAATIKKEGKDGGRKGKGRETKKEDEEEDASSFQDEATYLGSIVKANQPESEPLEEDYDTDLEEEKYPKSNPIPQRDRPRVVYLKACRRYNITPSSSFLRGIKDQVVNLNHLGIGPKGTMAVALSLVMCNTVSELHISGNSIGETGIKYITNMLKEDDNISVVDLSENDLQSYGANLVTSMIMENDNILSLRLSGNQFKAYDAQQFHTMISNYRCVLRVLDLSHNEFGEAGGLLLGEAIGNNDSIETLDISWNRLGVAGARAIAKGLQENICLKHLNMSWNGIGDEGGKLIAESLVTSDTLLSLDLCCNRISHVGLVDVMKGVTACKTLRKLDISRNPITFEGPVIALTILNEHLECGLNELVFVDMCVSGHFIPKLKEIRKQKPKFKVKHGGFLNGTDTIEHAWRQREENIMNDSMMKLLEYVHDKKLRWSDLFFQLDTDKSMSISEKEFIDGIKRAGIPLTDQQIRDLVERLDTDDDGEVDFGELIEGQKRYINRLNTIKDNADIDPNLLTRPDRPNTKQKSRPTSSNQASRPNSSSQRSRPPSSTRMSRPPSSSQKSRPPSSSQKSRPPSSSQKSRPSSSKVLSSIQTQSRPVSRDGPRPERSVLTEGQEKL